MGLSKNVYVIIGQSIIKKAMMSHQYITLRILAMISLMHVHDSTDKGVDTRNQLTN